MGAAVIMLIVVLAYQQVENNILTPKIQGKAVNLSGFFIIVAVTLFGALLGVLGALTAVPLAATIQIFVQELTKGAPREGLRGEGSSGCGTRGRAHDRALVARSDRDADRGRRDPGERSQEHDAADPDGDCTQTWVVELRARAREEQCDREENDPSSKQYSARGIARVHLGLGRCPIMDG